MRERTIVLLPYDGRWATKFERIRAHVREALSGVALAVEHVGSTSVPGLWAKPILDIDVAIPSYAEFPEVVQRLSTIGYRHRGDLGIETREAFAYEGEMDFMAQHFYVCPADSPEMRRHIALRDYLRTHPEAAAEYGRIKREGARLFPHDIDAYIAHKGGFIRRIYQICTAVGIRERQWETEQAYGGRESRLQRELLQTPEAAGIGMGVNWDSRLLQAYVQKVHGKVLSRSNLQKIMKAMGFSYTRPTYVLAKADSSR